MSKFVYVRDLNQMVFGFLITIWFGFWNIFLFLQIYYSEGLWYQTLIMGWIVLFITACATGMGLFLFFDSLFNPEFKKIKLNKGV